MKWVLLLLLGSLLALQAASLRVGGSLEKPADIDAAAFAALPQSAVEMEAMYCRSGAVKAPAQTRSGVLLRTLLERAGLKTTRRGELNRLVLLAEGGDGYGVTFSYHEFFNTRTGEGVLIVREGDGFSLYSRYDTVSGPRHVRDLRRLRVEPIYFTTTKGHP